MYENVTFMLCLPRSRSKWLSEFLSPVAVTLHDPLKSCASIEELGQKIDSILTTWPATPIFAADTAAVMFLPQIEKRFPNARYLLVFREHADIEKSLDRINAVYDPDTLLEAREMLNEAWHFNYPFEPGEARYQHVVAFEQINRRLLDIWRFVGANGKPDDRYVGDMVGRNIQVPLHVQTQLTDFDKVRRLFETRKEYNDAARRA